MTKAEMVAEISNVTGVEKEKALKVIEAMMVVVKEKTAVIVPEHKIPYFKPCEDYKNLLAK